MAWDFKKLRIDSCALSVAEGMPLIFVYIPNTTASDQSCGSSPGPKLLLFGDAQRSADNAHDDKHSPPRG